MYAGDVSERITQGKVEAFCLLMINKCSRIVCLNVLYGCSNIWVILMHALSCPALHFPALPSCH